MRYIKVIEKVSEELNLSQELVDRTYKAYWSFIRNTIQNLPLKDIKEEDFDRLKVNFNIPSLGKLCVTQDRYKGVKKRFEYINKLREKNDKTKED